MPPRKTRQSTTTDESASKSERTRARILDAAAEVLSRGLRRYAAHGCGAGGRDPGTGDLLLFRLPRGPDRRGHVVGIADMRKHMTAVLDDLPDGTEPMDRILVAVETHLRHELEISAYTTASIRNSARSRRTSANARSPRRTIRPDLA